MVISESLWIILTTHADISFLIISALVALYFLTIASIVLWPFDNTDCDSKNMAILNTVVYNWLMGHFHLLKKKKNAFVVDSSP